MPQCPSRSHSSRCRQAGLPGGSFRLLVESGSCLSGKARSAARGGRRTLSSVRLPLRPRPRRGSGPERGVVGPAVRQRGTRTPRPGPGPLLGLSGPAYRPTRARARDLAGRPRPGRARARARARAAPGLVRQAFGLVPNLGPVPFGVQARSAARAAPPWKEQFRWTVQGRPPVPLAGGLCHSKS